MKAELITPPVKKNVQITMSEDQARTLRILIGHASIADIVAFFSNLGYEISSKDAGVFHEMWDALNDAGV